MNFHSDEWIVKRLEDHLQEAQTLIPKEHIVGIFLQGSQNYGLDYEGSDIDSKCIVTPTLKAIALAKSPISTTHIRANDEHIDMKDIRLYIQTFRKQNLNFLEILFTPYYFVSPEYAKYWDMLVAKREEITHYDPVRSVKSMRGIAAEKYYAMEHRYPSRAAVLDKYGYDPKQLSHLLRVSEYLQRCIANEPYEDCLLTKQADYLKKVKLGFYDLNKARDIAEKEYNKVHSICDVFIEQHKKDPVNQEIDEFLNDISYQIIEKSIKRDLVGEDIQGKVISSK